MFQSLCVEENSVGLLMFKSISRKLISYNFAPGGYFQIRRSVGGGGLDLTSSLEAKFGARSDQVHQISGKILGSSVTTRRKSWVPILGSYLKFRGQNLGYLPFMFLEAKFVAPARISDAKFGGKTPRPANMEVPPGILQVVYMAHSLFS